MDVLVQSVQEEQFDKNVENISENEQYSTMSKDELILELNKALQEKPLDELKSISESIKTAFYKRNKADIENAKKEFIAQGGNIDDFKIEADDKEATLKNLLAQYRQRRNEANAIIEKERAENLAKKLELIEKLKELVERSENSDTNTYPEFSEIQKQWHEIGAVPKEQLNELWNSYHFQIESYYNIIKINKELRDLDYKKNLEQRIALCESAEQLSLQTSYVEAFKELQILHEKWREIGPVAKEHKDEIWDRFKQASTIINKNHQEYFEKLNAEQESNLNIKREFCQKVEALLETIPQNRKEWDEKTQELLNIQELWKTIGFAPKKDNTKVYETFKSLCNKFFEEKQNYFKGKKEHFMNVLQIKTEICEQANKLKDSQEWQKTTAELIALQKQWKEIGGAASKELDELWKSFRESCDYFFERKQEHFKELESSYAELIAKKEQIIEELKNFVEENPHTAIEKLKEIQRRWTESGFVPARIQNPLYAQYKEIIDTHFTNFKKNLSQLNLDNFKNKVSSKSSKTEISREKERLQKRLQKLETDISTLENNIGFFSKSSNAEGLIKDIQQKIANTKEEISNTKEKIKHIITEERNRNEKDA